MLTGTFPNKENKTGWLIEKLNLNKLRLPKYISPAGRNLLEGLLCTDFRKRIGFQGPDQIKQHSFFEGIDWEAVYTKQLDMPVPEKKVIPDCFIAESKMPTGASNKYLDSWSFIYNN